MNSVLWKRPPAKLSILRSELHVWRIDLNNVNYLPNDLSSLLSSEEIKRMEHFKFERDQHRYQVTHSMKRLILANYLACDPQCLFFDVGSYGKPSLASLQNSFNIQFNLSHSHHLILLAVTLEDSIGIDIEYCNKKFSIEGLSEIIFSPHEKLFFSALNYEEEKKEVFFRCWTRKEAYLKAIGMGLTQDITNISVDLNKEVSPDNWLKTSTLSPLEIMEWKLFPLDIDNYYMANAVTSSFQKNLFCYNANEQLYMRYKLF